MSAEAKALAEFRLWADARGQRIVLIIAFYARYVAAVVLMAISSGCIALARLVAPVQ